MTAPPENLREARDKACALLKSLVGILNAVQSDFLDISKKQDPASHYNPTFFVHLLGVNDYTPDGIVDRNDRPLGDISRRFTSWWQVVYRELDRVQWEWGELVKKEIATFISGGRSVPAAASTGMRGRDSACDATSPPRL